jgi:NADPH:quinone reductase-like Zn-dependent oxidoreductase
MRAVAIDRFGGPEVLRVRSLPVPELGAQDVLIALDYAGVGIWDASLRQGDTEQKKFPLILGTDGAGVIAAVGEGVTRFRPGNRVYSYSYENRRGGYYAEFAAVAASKVGFAPPSIDPLHAGAVTVIGLTALQGVDDALELEEGETVIIHGAGGNVGMLAVQFALFRGARVLATATGNDGVAFVRALGADVVIDGRREDSLVAARRFAPKGVDAVLAFSGGKELTRCLDALKSRGRVAYPNGVEPAPRKRKGVKMTAYDAVPSPRSFARLSRAIEETKLRIPIAEVFDLDDVAKAHRRIEKGHVLGKIVLRISASR